METVMKKRTAFAFITLLFMTSVCHAAEVPVDLSQWREWALHGHEKQVCPPVYNNQGDFRCYWPSTMDMNINSKGGRFDLKVRLFAPSWVVLPGGQRIWPQDVLVQGKKSSVSLRQNNPALYLDPGEYRITGSFSWDKMPESIPVPRDSGLVTLVVDGVPVRFPDFRSGQLWLKDKGGEEESAEDSLEIQVYRLMDDMVPFRAVTRLEVDVAGQQREILIGPVLPVQSDEEMFIPVQLSSPLTARLENDGRLRLQVRPGHWRIDIQSRSIGPVEALPVPSIETPWPSEEIWVFRAHTDL
jgi:hypothetical protein